jgi:hypothetical protein
MFAQTLSRPYLTVWHPLPDLPHPALLRALYGHTNQVNACAISPCGQPVIRSVCPERVRRWVPASASQILSVSSPEAEPQQ